MTKKEKSPRPYPILFDDALRIAARVVRTCERGKIVREDLAWVLCLLASIISSGYSIRTLLRRRRVWDCLLINRRMHEAAFDVHYILNNPGNAGRLRAAYMLEQAADDYQTLKAGASRDGLTVRQLLQRKPQLQHIADEFRNATAQWETMRRSTGRQRRGKKKLGVLREPGKFRWMELSWQEKAAGLNLPKHAWEIIKFIMHEGNSVAHSRPQHLRVFLKRKPGNNPSFCWGPVARNRYHFNMWNAALLPLIIAADQISSAYCISERFEAGIGAIVEDVKLHGKIREMKSAPRAGKKSE